jgi:AmmeMemoRadiSam system protein B
VEARIDALLDAAVAVLDQAAVTDEALCGVVVPHAGYEYSGPVAATAFALLAALVPPPGRVIILGPSHFVAGTGCAVPTHTAWNTPLGDVAIDASARATALGVGAVADDTVHRTEHSIEVQLPWLQRIYPGVPVLPIAVGPGERVAGITMLGELMADDSVLVVSTDLSHYLASETARRRDRRTASAVEALDAGSLRPQDACGYAALQLGIAWAQDSGLRIRLLDLRNSADTAGDARRVVGYGSFAISRVSATP